MSGEKKAVKHTIELNGISQALHEAALKTLIKQAVREVLQEEEEYSTEEESEEEFSAKRPKTIIKGDA